MVTNVNVIDKRLKIETNRHAWGDGSHHSTDFMLAAISKYVGMGDSVLDIGTGSGILSVLCGKLGAAPILAIDNNRHALEVAAHNFKVNSVIVETKQNELTHGLDYKADVVLANLPSTVQLENIKSVADCMKDGGLLIMTWFKIFPFDVLVKGFEVVEYVDLEEYDGYVLRKEVEKHETD